MYSAWMPPPQRQLWRRTGVWVRLGGRSSKLARSEHAQGVNPHPGGDLGAHITEIGRPGRALVNPLVDYSAGSLPRDLSSVLAARFAITPETWYATASEPAHYKSPTLEV